MGELTSEGRPLPYVVVVEVSPWNEESNEGSLEHPSLSSDGPRLMLGGFRRDACFARICS
nr:hypothetical protein Q903MT_gene3626 [Picea sitchensis]